MTSIKQAGLVVALAALVSSPAVAQRATQQGTTRHTTAQSANAGIWEIGADANLGFGLDKPQSFFINIPVPMIRAAYFMNDAVSLEPALGFNSFARKNNTAFSAWYLQLGALYHFTPDRMMKQVFVHPLLAFSGGSGGARTLTYLGVGLGVKQPRLGGRLATRLEVGINNRLQSGTIPSRTNIFGSAGISVYTR